MPITRSVWLDDDGTGTTGTVINNTELQKIYNNIEAFGGWQGINNSDTGNKDNWAPVLGGTQSTWLYWLGSADLHITGIVAGVEGQRLTLRSHSTAVIYLYHSHSSSVDVNRLELAVGSGPTPIANTGVAHLMYLSGRWRLIGHEQGAWIPTPFNASDYAGGITVTAGQVESRYRLSGRTLHWGLNITGGTLSGSITQFYIHLPQRFRLASGVNNSILLTPNGAWGVGRMGGGLGIDNLNVTKLDYSTMAAGSLYLQATIIQEVT